MANQKYVRETGVILPDTSELLESVQDEFRAALGSDIDLSPETVLGVLVAAEVEARDTVLRNNAALANQINPNIAGGVFLDAIWKLTGGSRDKATATLIRGAILTGVRGATVPAGAQASVGVGGALFELTSSVNLDQTGRGMGVFQSVEPGRFTAAAGALNTIVTPVLGWETVTNPNPADEGTDRESDAQSRRRRRRTLALQAVAIPEAIISGLNDVVGLRSMSFRENMTNQAMTVEDVTLVPHSIYVCVDGGKDVDIALMLLRKKSMGCAWNGDTEVEVIEPVSGQTYPVRFDRAKDVQIYARVTIRDGSPYLDAPNTVREAMVAYANGEQQNERGFVVGNDVSAFELASAVNRVAPEITVTNVEISRDGQTYSSATIPITISEVARMSTGNIGVTVEKE